MKTHRSLFLLLLFTNSAWALDGMSGKNFALDLTMGVPQLISPQLSFVRFFPFTFGIGFGAAPVQGIVSKQVSLSPVPVAFSSTDTYNLYPSATFSLTSLHLFARFFPLRGGWFFYGEYSSLTFRASVSGDLKNETTGGTLGSAVTGHASLAQPMLGFGSGYQIAFSNGLFFEGGLGGEYLLNPSNEIVLSGQVSSLVPLIPDAEESFDQSEQQVKDQFDSAVNEFKGKVRFVPTVFLAIGWAF